LFLRIIQILTPIIILPSLYYCILFSPVEKTIGVTYRAIFFHIPSAWLAVVAFVISFIGSLLYLAKEKKYYDRLAHRSAEIGLLFSLIATATGSVFAYFTWGSAWNWDPRETSIVILIIIYIAYLALRSSIGNKKLRPRISAVYSLVAFLTVPFLVFIVPRITPSLHPEAVGGSGLTGGMWIGLVGMLVGFTLLFIQILHLALRIDKKNEEKSS
jgi:heme exporter protein C